MLIINILKYIFEIKKKKKYKYITSREGAYNVVNISTVFDVPYGV